MSQRYNEMRESIIGATALIEALIDFGEDEGISQGVFESGPFVPPSVSLLYAESYTNYETDKRKR